MLFQGGVSSGNLLVLPLPSDLAGLRAETHYFHLVGNCCFSLGGSDRIQFLMGSPGHTDTCHHGQVLCIGQGPIACQELFSFSSLMSLVDVLSCIIITIFLFQNTSIIPPTFPSVHLQSLSLPPTPNLGQIQIYFLSL